MKVTYVESPCDSSCANNSIGKCLLKVSETKRVFLEHDYEVTVTEVLNGILYYQLMGWGSLRFNAKHFVPV